ncbi:MAG: Uncharacterised protein [Rhodothermaeota bacterium MED-G12]|nr:MAG: Uncharacterised protein [Rhodothermaeota bacterium MED-G12]
MALESATEFAVSSDIEPDIEPEIESDLILDLSPFLASDKETEETARTYCLDTILSPLGSTA